MSVQSVHHYNEERGIFDGPHYAVDPMILGVAALGDEDAPWDTVIVRVQPFGIGGHTRLVFATDRAGAQVLIDMLTEALAAGPQPVVEVATVDAAVTETNAAVTA